jgi:hypothetical protein
MKEDNSVTYCELDDPGSYSQRIQTLFVFANTSRQPEAVPKSLFSGVWILSCGSRTPSVQLTCNPSSAKVKKAWSVTSTPTRHTVTVLSFP